MKIQIVVPVFNAYHQFKDCFEALLKHNVMSEVVFINDASTDQRVNELLTDLPNNWQAFHNPTNLGFVKTANSGLKRQTGHSILLNSDTIVSVGWLDRFQQAIENIGDLGTATPWSNNAEICSIPEKLSVNPMPEDINQVARELDSQHHPQYPELPTAVGFCMLITAEAKRRVGYFDEDTFGLGYGEENDYSMRVVTSGLRNVLVDNCYVAHVGNQSFQELGLKPNAETMDRLLAKHPGYSRLIQNFIEKDPLSSLRQAIIDKISGF